MARCELCHLSDRTISRELGVCLRCIREDPDQALPLAGEAHRRSRREFGLPEKVPKHPDGLACIVCVNECLIPEGERGYCGLRINEGAKLTGVSSDRGKLSWYSDPLPTNCVADWVCPAGTGCGYPEYSLTSGPEVGYSNLAVFFHACSLECLSCQNWQFRNATMEPEVKSPEDLAEAVDDRTACICYFGGDPAPQAPFAIQASQAAMKRRKKGILRICWETNGTAATHLMDDMLELSLTSGGCVKFDLKAHDEKLALALTGVTNRRTLENFQRTVEASRDRPIPPPVVASTLMVPGYIDESEIRSIARFIASADPGIPYSLLAFYPHFRMRDLPLMTRDEAEAMRDSALAEGLTRVKLGNEHLLR